MGQLIIGTYTETLPHVAGQAAGILGTAFQEGVVAAEPELLAPVRNPSWVTSTPDGRFVYAAVETTDFEGAPGGGLVAFARNTETGALTALNTRTSAGTEPCHLAVDPSGTYVLVANYGSGSIAVFPRGADGALGELVCHVQHAGHSVHPLRQTGPHVHMICFDPATGDLLTPDLGMDAVLTYRLERSGELVELVDRRLTAAPGAGPRHLAFSPDGSWLFVVNELDSTLVALHREETGFSVRTVASTLPADFAGESFPSEVRVSNSGRHVFVANRGHDSIAMVSFDPADGALTLVANEPTRGRQPRDFIVLPGSGNLLVANQDSDSVLEMVVDEDAGVLHGGDPWAAPTPVCLHLVG